MRPNLRLQERNLCAVSPLGDSCRGDSGGGLVRVNCGARYIIYHSYRIVFINLFRFYELVGVVSSGIGCNSTINGKY